MMNREVLVSRQMINKKKKRIWKIKKQPVPVVIILGLLTIVLIASAVFYNYLEEQFFKERAAHLTEVAGKASQILNTDIESSWKQVSICQNLIQERILHNKSELLYSLEKIAAYVGNENAVVLAIDQNARYYSSDRQIGQWSDIDNFIDRESEQQEIVYMPSYEDEEITYMLFLQKLPQPKRIGEDEIIYVALAARIDFMEEVLKMSSFGESCVTYIVNSSGHCLYHQIYTEGIFDTYDIITAMEQMKFIHGGNVENLKHNIADGTSGSLEFDYYGEQYFVALAPLDSKDWSVMLFVPTTMLETNEGVFMNGVVRYFTFIAVCVVMLISYTIYIITVSQNDKIRMKQQDKTNHILAKAAQKAVSASAAKSEFLSHMSHDIRTPINGIMGMTDIAMRNIKDEKKVEDCLKKIMSSSNHLLSLVNDVLDMSRIESGKMTVNHAPVNMNIIIENCASIISGQLLNRDVEMIQQFDTLVHPRVLGDELHLRQVLINILGNAVKFTPDGGKIYFRVHEVGESGDKAVFHFEIEDTGIGMKPEFLQHIWEPFMQEDGGVRTVHKGTGLGMSITRKFVDLMGGTITVESTLNVGSKFIVELPIEIDRDCCKEEQVLPDVKVEVKGMKVLLVEDNELNMEIAQCLLESEGVSVVTAENGQVAVEKFQRSSEGTFDVIFMDLMMPVMDGLTATRTIRALNHPDASTIPIIAMTANAYDEDIRKTHEAGMNAHLSKPVDCIMMFKVLENYKKSVPDARLDCSDQCVNDVTDDI